VLVMLVLACMPVVTEVKSGCRLETLTAWVCPLAETRFASVLQYCSRVQVLDTMRKPETLLGLGLD
jgi:hypothetical protein